MTKIIYRLLPVLLIVFSLTFATVANAEVKIYDGVGQYVMSDFENQDIAKQRAQRRAEAAAKKKAGVYLKTYSRSVNSELTKEEISAVTNRIIDVFDVDIKEEPFEVKGETGIIYTATLKAKIDSDGIQNFINLDAVDKIILVKQNEQLQEEIDKNDKLNDSLIEQYERTKSPAEKEKIRRQMEGVDRDCLANEKLAKGDKLLNAGNYEEAIKLFDEAIKLNSNLALAYNDRGEAYRYLGKFYEAVENYNKAIEINPNFDWPYSNRGVVNMDDYGRYELAIQDFNKALKLNPNYAIAYGNRGWAYYNLKKYDLAIKDCDKAIKLNPKLSFTYNNRGVIYKTLEQYDKAIADYGKAIENNPKHRWAYTNRAYIYLTILKQYDKAIADYTKAVENNPNHGWAYYYRGLAYYNLGQYDLAIQDYDKAIELNPNNSDAYSSRELAYVALGKTQGADSDSAEANEINPALVDDPLKRGDELFNAGDYAKAVEFYNKAIELDPNNAAAYQSRGKCREAWSKQDFERAKELGYEE